MLAVFVMFNAGRIGKVKLVLTIAPRAAQVTVDGKAISSTSIYVKKGKHTVNASLSGFQSASRTVEVQKETTVTMALPPQGQAGTEYLLNHPDAQRQLQAIGDAGATKTGEILARKYPYLDQLPILTSNFTVYQAAPVRSKVAPGDADIALRVTAYSPIDRARAVDRIREDLGIDPSTVEIIFAQAPNIFVTGDD